MVGRRWSAVQSWKLVQKTLAIALAIQILLGNGSALASSLMTTAQLTETASPKTFLDLGQVLDQYQPQIKIISPKAGQLLSDNTVTVNVQLQDLPIYKDKSLGLGPHLHLVVDDQPHQSIYSAEPIVLKDLEPGTHTVRIFAATPWDEAFKNDGAFAQVTFDVFTKTDDNRPQTQKPLLTYNQPQGTYGAEPILLDFYVTNAPLHLIAQESDIDNVQDWKVKATVNGQSFLLDRWQPTYLKGFKPGKNWVQLEFIDEKGNRVENFGNNTARIFNYQPGGQDPLAQLTRGEISIAQAKGIVDPTYTPTSLVKPIEPNVPAVKSTKSIEIPAPVKLAPNASKITPKVSDPTPIVPIIPIVPSPKPPELKAVDPKPSIAPVGKPTKPIELQPDQVQKEVQTPSPSIVKPPNVKQTLPNSASRRTIREKLPSFIGPGKKIEVKTSVTPPAIVITKPVELKAKSIPKAVKVPPVIETDQESSKTGTDLPNAVEPKTPTIDSDVPKKRNWFNRFRKSDESARDLNKDSAIKTEVPTAISEPIPRSTSVPSLPIVSPKKINGVFSPPALELTKDQKMLLSTQKESSIETRKPFKLFSPGKKDELPTVQPSVKPDVELKPEVIVKNKLQNTVKPITKTPIVKPKPEVIRPEVVKPEIVKPEALKPENQTKSEDPKSIVEGDSMKSLVDRLNKMPTPTNLKPFPTPTQPSITGDELLNQLKPKINPPKAAFETPPTELPASKTAGE